MTTEEISFLFRSKEKEASNADSPEWIKLMKGSLPYPWETDRIGDTDRADIRNNFVRQYFYALSSDKIISYIKIVKSNLLPLLLLELHYRILFSPESINKTHLTDLLPHYSHYLQFDNVLLSFTVRSIIETYGNRLFFDKIPLVHFLISVNRMTKSILWDIHRELEEMGRDIEKSKKDLEILSTDRLVSLFYIVNFLNKHIPFESDQNYISEELIFAIAECFKRKMASPEMLQSLISIKSLIGIFPNHPLPFLGPSANLVLKETVLEVLEKFFEGTSDIDSEISESVSNFGLFLGLAKTSFAFEDRIHLAGFLRKTIFFKELQTNSSGSPFPKGINYVYLTQLYKKFAYYDPTYASATIQKMAEITKKLSKLGLSKTDMSLYEYFSYLASINIDSLIQQNLITPKNQEKYSLLMKDFLEFLENEVNFMKRFNILNDILETLQRQKNSFIPPPDEIHQGELDWGDQGFFNQQVLFKHKSVVNEISGILKASYSLIDCIPFSLSSKLIQNQQPKLKFGSFFLQRAFYRHLTQ